MPLLANPQLLHAAILLSVAGILFSYRGSKNRRFAALVFAFVACSVAGSLYGFQRQWQQRQVNLQLYRQYSAQGVAQMVAELEAIVVQMESRQVVDPPLRKRIATLQLRATQAMPRIRHDASCLPEEQSMVCDDLHRGLERYDALDARFLAAVRRIYAAKAVQTTPSP